MGLDLGQDVRDVAVAVSASGHIDSVTVAMLHASLEGALQEAGSHPARKLAIDLEPVTYLGSSGLNAVLTRYERGVSDGVAVRVAAVNPEVTRPIEVNRLDSVLRPYGIIADAVNGVDSD